MSGSREEYIKIIISKIANEDGKSEEFVRKKMQKLLDYMYENGVMKEMGFNKKPTLEDWIIICAGVSHPTEPKEQM